MKIYIRTVTRMLLWLLLSFLVFLAVRSVIRTLYYDMHQNFGSAFPTYNPVTDKEKYLEFESKLSAAASAIVFFILSFISTVFDNERYEYMIKETDGLYTIKKGFRIYFSRYAICDLVSSFLAPLPFFLLSLIKFPKTNMKFLIVLEEWLGGFLACPLSLISQFEFALGYVIAAALVLLGMAVAAPIGLRRWRALWLSGIDD